MRLCDNDDTGGSPSSVGLGWACEGVKFVANRGLMQLHFAPMGPSLCSAIVADGVLRTSVIRRAQISYQVEPI